MAFNNDKAIYLQIADRLSDEILAGVYKAFDRIPSVREYAATLGVNANTAVKAYDQLAQEGIIFNKRGLGYFVAEDAQRYIKQTRRQTFLQDNPPRVCPPDEAPRHHMGRGQGKCSLYPLTPLVQ